MTVLAHPTALTFPYPTPPEPGSVMEIAPGILWLRLALPYRLDHVNVYLIEDGAGWALLDTGLDDATTRAAWETLLVGPLAARPLTRVLVTHYHPDHMGLAGWLCDQGGTQLSFAVAGATGLAMTALVASRRLSVRRPVAVLP